MHKWPRQPPKLKSAAIHSYIYNYIYNKKSATLATPNRLQTLTQPPNQTHLIKTHKSGDTIIFPCLIKHLISISTYIYIDNAHAC